MPLDKWNNQELQEQALKQPETEEQQKYEQEKIEKNIQAWSDAREMWDIEKQISDKFADLEVPENEQEEIIRLLLQLSKENRDEYIEEIQDYSSKKDILLVGDSLTSDICGANKAGIDCCWYNPYGANPTNKYRMTYMISELRQLLAIL